MTLIQCVVIKMSKQEVVEIIRKVDNLKEGENILINLRGNSQVKIFARRKGQNIEDSNITGWVFPWYVYKNNESHSYDIWSLDKLMRLSNHLYKGIDSIYLQNQGVNFLLYKNYDKLVEVQ